MFVSSSGRCTAIAALTPSSAASTGAASAAVADARQAGSAAIERGQVHEQLGVLRLHPLDVRRARRRALVEGVPQPLVLALVVRVQADRHRLELRRDGRGVLGVALADAAHEVGALAEPAPEEAVDLDHPARVAGLRGSGGESPLAGSGVAGMNRLLRLVRVVRRRFERSHSSAVRSKASAPADPCAD